MRLINVFCFLNLLHFRLHFIMEASARDLDQTGATKEPKEMKEQTTNVVTGAKIIFRSWRHFYF